MSLFRARMIDATINDRSRRLQHRLKQNALCAPDTNDAKKSKNMTKKARLVASPVVGKEKMGCSLECSDNDNTHTLACCDESVNDALEQTNQLGKDNCDVNFDNHNHIRQMTITHNKEDEAGLLRIGLQVQAPVLHPDMTCLTNAACNNKL